MNETIIQVDSAVNFNLGPHLDTVDDGNDDGKDLYYPRINNRGECIVLDYLDNAQTQRTVKQLESTFKRLNYHFQHHPNLNNKQTLKLLDAQVGQSAIDSCFLFILTTSCREVISCANQTRIKSDLLIDSLNGKNSKSLAGKPKIVIIQEFNQHRLICDGGNDRLPKPCLIPTYADMLIYTFRGGSPIFLQTLCSIMRQHSNNNNNKFDLVKQLTMVTNVVHERTGTIPEMFSTTIKLIRI
ncbi:Caspase-3 [Dermatophagoides farinae]|uniref:Caspase-3 n=1 Tax=Dermatophagoides farinae TaxID=6954 RepID=A0A922I552_DERFA|nr:uncharacterized protein LOC124494679 [Dermatophagoides farinae]KAH7637464.1 hypothetical protein HUG17_7670 [Dermatophagoides farinae]KAH9521413.1 Caspase-3 [Dermatophagoides farinae]